MQYPKILFRRQNLYCRANSVESYFNLDRKKIFDVVVFNDRLFDLKRRNVLLLKNFSHIQTLCYNQPVQTCLQH